MENENKNINEAENTDEIEISAENVNDNSISHENLGEKTEEITPAESETENQKTEIKHVQKEKKEHKKVTLSFDMKKIKHISISVIGLIFLSASAVLLLNFFSPERFVVIKMLNGEIYRGKIIMVTDTKLFYQKGKDVFDDFEIAYSENLDYDISFSTEKIEEIDSIHYILRQQKNEEPDPEVTKAPKENYDTNIFGTYHIFLSGHEGTLYIKYKNGRIYGGVQFPNWANGVYEPLKDVKLKNGELTFTRSATTLKDIRRIGISSYFTQTYTGRLYPKTAEIKGFFTNSGARQSWHAVKIK